MKVLVLNSGSSSVKYALFDSQNLIRSALIERVENHNNAIADILSEIGTIDAVGHRIVHGGETYTGPVRIDSTVIQAIEDLIPLAPLHNRANLAGIKAVQE